MMIGRWIWYEEAFKGGNGEHLDAVEMLTICNPKKVFHYEKIATENFNRELDT